MQIHLRRLALPVLAAALLQACGGGGGDTSDDAAAGSGAPSAPTSSSPPTPSPAPADPAAPPAAAPDITCGLPDFEAEVLRIVNQVRAAGATCGSRGSFGPAPALTIDSRLVTAAYGHSRDMADNDYFSHDSLDGRSIADRVDATGYRWTTLGENIAAGYGTVQGVVDAWMASDGHCANLMNPRFTQVGVACARNDASRYGIYWTQDFGRP